MIDIKTLRNEFPLLNNSKTIYLDNSATSQRPESVLTAVKDYYETFNANPMRGLYDLSVESTERYEAARQKVADFIGAKESAEIIFTRNATESLNLVAVSYGESHVKAGDDVIISIAEHHSNLLPWQRLCEKTGANLIYFECEPDGSFPPERLQDLMTDKTRIVAMTQMSNLFGRVNDIKTYAEIAHGKGAVFVCDGAQSVPHIPVDVQELNVDFLAFSGHKMYAPMGIGALYGKRELLEEMPPFLYGGEMIEYVTRCGASYAEVPHKFEAGTVNCGGAIGLHAAISFMEKYGWEDILKREEELSFYAVQEILKVPYVTLLGSQDPMEHHGILTFKLEGVHPHDVAAIFDEHHIGVRAGHHCAQPLHKHLGVLSTTRASIAFYNTKEEIDAFIECLGGIRKEMGYGE